ncbi:RES domain-containing protein [Parabacteroides pacaensis]|uniref:RES domain-containing protein n=1 Tax=Parabacteroides pacaensis TaxID=2086575 RepID=UPI00131E03FD|nr:RES domain-containing protein [Parabacteroides pacaensis]
MKELYEQMKQLFFMERENDDFLENLFVVLQKYVEILQTYNSSLSYITDDNITEVKKTNKDIKKCIEYYLEGRYHLAYRLVERLLNKIIGENYHVVSVNEIFYRCRTKKTEDTEEISSCIKMFHIPFNERHKVSTQRYSAPGYPCLYLGSSIYNCWQELGCNCNNLYASHFGVRNEFRVIDLRFPELDDLTDNNNVVTFLKKFPLILSTSQRIHQNEKEGTFHPEYIISQLITEYIITGNNKKHKNKKCPFGLFDFVLGVYYTSTHIDSRYKASLSLFSNLALPAIDFKTKKTYCQYLASYFSITDPLRCKCVSINKELNELSDEDIKCIFMGLLEIEIELNYRQKYLYLHSIVDNKLFRLDNDIEYKMCRLDMINSNDVIIVSPDKISSN